MTSFFQVKWPKWHWNWISTFSTHKLGFVRKKKKTISKICMVISVILIIKLLTNLWSGTQEWIYLEFKKNVVKISGILIFKSMDQRWHLNWIFTFQHMSSRATYVRSIIGYCDVNALQQKPPLRNLHTSMSSLYIYDTNNVASYSLLGQVPNQHTEKKSIESLIICFLFNSLLHWENKNSFGVLVGFCSYCSRTGIWF